MLKLNKLAKIFGYLVISFGMLLFFIASFFQLKEEILLSIVVKELNNNTNLSWNIKGPLLPSVFPVGFSFSEVYFVSNDDSSSPESYKIKTSVDRVVIRFSVLKLLEGKVNPELIFLKSPKIEVYLSNTAESSDNLSAESSNNPSIESGQTNPNKPDGGSKLLTNNTEPNDDLAAKLSISNSLNATTNNTTIDSYVSKNTLSVLPEDITDNLNSISSIVNTTKYILTERIPKEAPKIIINNGVLKIFEADGSDIVEILDYSVRLFPRNPDDFFNAKGDIVLSKDINASFLLDVQMTPKNENVILTGISNFSFNIKNPKGEPIAITVNAPFAWEESGEDVVCSNLEINAEGDKLYFDGTVSFTQQLVMGKIKVEQFSLPKWFNFGRNLPPGLQHQLDSLKGDFNLTLSLTGAWATDLRLFANELLVTGNISTENFSIPVIDSELFIDQIDIDKVLPFLSVSENSSFDYDDLSFKFPPLIPYKSTDEPEAPHDDSHLPEVGYHIVINANKANIHSLLADKVKVTISPNKDTSTKIAFVANKIASGSLSGYLDVGEKSVVMSFSPSKIDVAKLPENIGNSVDFLGTLTGSFDIVVPIKNSNWDSLWSFKTKGEVSSAEIKDSKPNSWYLKSSKVTIAGSGNLESSKIKGISLDGKWDLVSDGTHYSWSSKSQEKIDMNLNGGLSWPKYTKDGKLASGFTQKGINKVYGDYTAKGTITVPIGAMLLPVSGSLSGNLDWDFPSNKITMAKFDYNGLRSKINGNVVLDFNEKFNVNGKVSFALSLPEMLSRWDLMPSSAIKLPDVTTGSSDISANTSNVSFTKLSFTMNKDTLVGSAVCSLLGNYDTLKGTNSLPSSKKTKAISYEVKENEQLRGLSNSKKLQEALLDSNKSTASSNSKNFAATKTSEPFWTFNLSGKSFDVDSLIPIGDSKLPPSTEPWNLRFIDGFNFDLNLDLESMHFQKLNFNEVKILGKLLGKRYSLDLTSNNFYTGKVTFYTEGKFQLPSTIVVESLKSRMHNFSVYPLLKDYMDTTDYGGRGDMAFSLSGNVSSSADMPGGLSGDWSMEISDGEYPAFIGSGSGLRNTFSKASASGVMNKGVLKWDNFVLKGIAVDMTGDGDVDLVKRTANITASVTLAKIPTIPVRISGSFDSLSVTVRGAHMVFHTVEAAGSTVFDLFYGVLSLPAKAIRGTASLFSSDEEESSDKESKKD